MHQTRTREQNGSFEATDQKTFCSSLLKSSRSHNDGQRGVGSRLRHFAAAWGELGTKGFVLAIVTHCYRLNLVGSCPRRSVIPDLPRVPELRSSMITAVEDLIVQGTAVEVPREEQGRGNYSRVNLRRKTSGKYRLIINLKPLNKHARYKLFIMESIYSLQNVLSQGCFLCSLDIKDVHLHVPIHLAHHALLHFAIRDHGQVLHFQFVALLDWPPRQESLQRLWRHRWGHQDNRG